MNGTEIRERIDSNNALIRDLMDKFDFTLNNELNVLLKENEKIRDQCHHEFEDGVCIWCDELEVSV